MNRQHETRMLPPVGGIDLVEIGIQSQFHLPRVARKTLGGRPPRPPIESLDASLSHHVMDNRTQDSSGPAELEVTGLRATVRVTCWTLSGVQQLTRIASSLRTATLAGLPIRMNWRAPCAADVTPRPLLMVRNA